MAYGEEAVILGVGLVPVLLAFHAYKLLEFSNGDKWNQAISIFLMLMSFLGLLTVVNTAMKISLHSAQEVVYASTEKIWLLVIITLIVVFLYFVLRMLFNSLELAFRGGRKREE